MLSGIDLAIVIGFLVLVTIVGYLLSKMASEGIESYFLGGNKIPWWLLGISTATSNFDMSGTMIIVAVVFGLGYKGFLVEIRGGVGMSLAFILVFLAKWLRRSRVMTSAEWMKLRFGTDTQGKTAHMLSSIANIVLSLGMIIYFAKGSGKFLEDFLPFSELTCTTAMVAVGLFYTLMSGLYGVVFTDVIQMLLLTFTAIFITITAFAVTPEVTNLPPGFFSLDLANPVAGQGEMLLKADPGYWEPIFAGFGLAVMCWVFRTTLEGMGGIGGYTDQRFFAARSEREASLLGLEAVVLSVFRWTMVAGLVILGYKLLQDGGEAAAIIAEDPEKVLPQVLQATLPVGIKGVVLAGLIAAAMSTFDSTLNAGASYIVKDVYQAYVNPAADMKQLMAISKYATIGLCIAGVALAAVVPNINDIWGLITMGLGAGLFVPLFLRWYWPRFNGYGFAVGTAVGGLAGLIINKGTELPLYEAFPLTILIALVASVVVTLATPPTKEDVLINFAVQTNSWGFWGGYLKKAEERGVISAEDRAGRFGEKIADVLAVCFALPFQISLLLGGMALVFHDWKKFSFFAVVVVVCGVGMYFFWWKNLKSEERSKAEDERYKQLPSGWDEVDQYVDSHASAVGSLDAYSDVGTVIGVGPNTVPATPGAQPYTSPSDDYGQMPDATTSAPQADEPATDDAPPEQDDAGGPATPGFGGKA